MNPYELMVVLGSTAMASVVEDASIKLCEEEWGKWVIEGFYKDTPLLIRLNCLEEVEFNLPLITCDSTLSESILTPLLISCDGLSGTIGICRSYSDAVFLCYKVSALFDLSDKEDYVAIATTIKSEYLAIRGRFKSIRKMMGALNKSTDEPTSKAPTPVAFSLDSLNKMFDTDNKEEQEDDEV
jgi:hypothetical protein